MCRTSAGLVLAAAGGQTGCPDSTEGRLLCLPRVARGSLERRALRRPTVVPRSGKEQERRRDGRVSERGETARVRRRESAASRRRAVTRARARASACLHATSRILGAQTCAFSRHPSFPLLSHLYIFLSFLLVLIHECRRTSLANALGLRPGLAYSNGL